MRIAAAYYVGTEKKIKIPLPFLILAVFTAISMVLSEIFARMRRKRISPVQQRNSNNTNGKNMVISNLIPFTKLNLMLAFDLFISVFIKLLNTTQMGVPKLSIHTAVMLVLLVMTNSEARRHFKRKVAGWRGVDFLEVVELQQQPIQRRQATHSQPTHSPKVHHPNQILQTR